MAGQLKTPPLVEALLEIKWKLKKIGPDTFEDPGYHLASGRLYDRINKRFGYIQNLPVSAVPEELTAYTVRQQFRKSKNGWPLVQLGPGVATVNFTSPYTWKNFRDNVKYFVPNLLESYKGITSEDKNASIEIASILLRYINAVELDWSQNNALEFLSTKLHSSFTLPTNITDCDLISGMPLNINLQVGHQISDPKGQALIRVATGNVGQSKGLIWELLFLSAGEDACQLMPVENFLDWLTKAHDVLEKWFFSMIDGELKTQFN